MDARTRDTQRTQGWAGKSKAIEGERVINLQSLPFLWIYVHCSHAGAGSPGLPMDPNVHPGRCEAPLDTPQRTFWFRKYYVHPEDSSNSGLRKPRPFVSHGPLMPAFWAASNDAYGSRHGEAGCVVQANLS